jgi:hypothetical protein
VKGTGWARVLGALLAVGLLAAVVLIAGLDGSASGERGSVRNRGDDGWLALYLLFEELGLSPEAWQGTLQELPEGRHALWWGRSPRSEGESATGAPDAHDLWLEQGADAPSQLRRFLVQGGRLVAPVTPATLDWLARTAGVSELEGARAVERARAAGPVRGPGGERFELAATGVQELRDLPPQVAREILLVDADGAALSWEVPVGRGSVVLLSQAELFDNAALRAGDAALLAARLAESLAPGGRLLFDERLGARGERPRLSALLAGPTLRLASLHALLLALLFLWWCLAPREFAREGRRAEGVCALERARARAALALRAGRASSLATPLREGVLRRACRRVRARPVDGDWRARLAGLRAAAGPRMDLERWTSACTRDVPDDPRALAELDLELRGLESELAPAHDAAVASPHPRP